MREAGIVTDDFAPGSLAAAVQELAALDLKEREGLRQKIKERAKRFDIAVMGEQTRSLYMSLLKERISR